MIINLRLCKLEPMSCTNHHSPISWLDNPAIPKLDQCSQCHTSVRTYKHPRRVCLSHRIHQLLLRCLLNNAIRIFQSKNRSVNRNRVTNLNCRCKSGIRLHSLEFFPPRFIMQINCIHPSKSVSILNTKAPLAMGWTNCAMDILFAGRNTMEGIPAEAQTVIPRSLKLPVWLIPQCFTHKSFMPRNCLPKRSAQKRLEFPSKALTISSLAIPGNTHSFLDQTPEPYGHVVFPTRESKSERQYWPSNFLRASMSCWTSRRPPERLR
nr:hypothetical protein PanWU01x14_246930 [Ipomoea batatas]GMC66111.1 hypothetical protein PanWU01x14_246930 [Ipomoea batatas]GMD14857.1 hypothetical protein PanWU01x14_246930 [Ipomoea batatas]GME14646.1 hypothetical protein PanWU01x14_246930 [Ipomoea batatas]